MRVSGGFYAGLLVLLVFYWPSALSELAPYHRALARAVWILNSGIGILTWYRTSSRRVGFFEGMSTIAATKMSGIANFTLLYLPPLLAVVYLRAVGHTLIGLSRGREYTQASWLRIVSSFVQQYESKEYYKQYGE